MTHPVHLSELSGQAFLTAAKPRRSSRRNTTQAQAAEWTADRRDSAVKHLSGARQPERTVVTESKPCPILLRAPVLGDLSQPRRRAPRWLRQACLLSRVHPPGRGEEISGQARVRIPGRNRARQPRSAKEITPRQHTNLWGQEISGRKKPWSGRCLAQVSRLSLPAKPKKMHAFRESNGRVRCRACAHEIQSGHALPCR